MSSISTKTTMKTWLFLWRLLGYRPWLYAADILNMILLLQFNVVVGLFIQAFFNSLPSSGQIRFETWTILLWMVGAAIISSVLHFAGVQAYILHRFSISGLLRHNLLKRILQKPGALAIPGSPGEAISNFRDDISNIETMITLLCETSGYTVFAIVSLVILLRVNTQITLLVFLPLIGIVTIAQAMQKRLERFRSASRDATGHVTSAIGEICGAVQAIQVAGAEQHVIQHFRKLSDQRRDVMLRDRVQADALDSVFWNTVGIGTGVILVLEALSLRTQPLRLGDLALFIYYLNFVTLFTAWVGRVLAQYPLARVSFGRLAALLQEAPAEALVEKHNLHLWGPLPAPARDNQGVDDRLETLEARNLTYRYAENGRGIVGINLQLTRGALTVITGRVASGKTTLLRTLLGLLPYEQGEILWNGQRVTEPASFFVPPRSAYTSQTPRLFSATLADNILLGIEKSETDLNEAIYKAVLEQDIDSFADGLDTLVGTRGLKLSGGQAQRTAAARMLVRDSELLVFDDLSSALDVETEQRLWERILSKQEKTCLVVSHRRAVLQMATHIIVLKDGQVEAEGDLATVLANSAEMRQLWHTTDEQAKQ